MTKYSKGAQKQKQEHQPKGEIKKIFKETDIAHLAAQPKANC